MKWTEHAMFFLFAGLALLGLLAALRPHTMQWTFSGGGYLQPVQDAIPLSASTVRYIGAATSALSVLGCVLIAYFSRRYGDNPSGALS